MMQHYLLPVAVFAAGMMGFLIDYYSFGPDAWRDKIAFLFYLPAVREGFNGGVVDGWLLGGLSQIVDVVKSGGNTYLAGAESNLVVGIIIAGVEVYTLGCLIPEKLSSWKWIGKFAAWKFPKSSSGRIGWKLVGLAVVIGLLSDNVGGAIGHGANFLIVLDCQAVGPILNWLFVKVW